MKKKILIIDDEIVFCKLISRWLEKNNFKVVTVHTGESGLEMLANEKFDLLLVDTLLPGMDGTQVCTLIRENSLYFETPIILMSAIYKDLGFVMQAKKIANDFIEKPFKEEEIVDRIKYLLLHGDTNPEEPYELKPQPVKEKETEIKIDLPPSEKVEATKRSKKKDPVKKEKSSKPKIQTQEEISIKLPDNHIDITSDTKDNTKSPVKSKVTKSISKKSKTVKSIQKELDDLYKLAKPKPKKNRIHQ